MQLMGPIKPASLKNYFRDSVPKIDNNCNDTKRSEAGAINMMTPGANGHTQFAALDMFLNSIGRKETKRKYVNKINSFLGFIGLEGSLEEGAQRFAEQAAKDSKWALACIIHFMVCHKAGYERKEITAGTLRNYYKPLRVFCEANMALLQFHVCGRLRGLLD